MLLASQYPRVGSASFQEIVVDYWTPFKCLLDLRGRVFWQAIRRTSFRRLKRTNPTRLVPTSGGLSFDGTKPASRWLWGRIGIGIGIGIQIWVHLWTINHIGIICQIVSLPATDLFRHWIQIWFIKKTKEKWRRASWEKRANSGNYGSGKKGKKKRGERKWLNFVGLVKNKILNFLFGLRRCTLNLQTYYLRRKKGGE